MSSSVFFYLILEEIERAERVQRKILRDTSNVLELSNSMFVSNFRLNKEAFSLVLEYIALHLPPSSISPMCALATTLRFFASGSFQRCVGNDVSVSLARSTVSKVLTQVLHVLEHHICPQWIALNMSVNEKNDAKAYFYRKYKIPGVVGCMDGTHIKIIKPSSDEHLYFNRKGYFSMNALIICDNNMLIRGIYGGYPGSCHDAHVWNLSPIRQHFLSAYETGDQCRLLADSGYALQPFVLTPYKNAAPETREAKFNEAHASARNIVERTIGALKSREVL